MRDRLSKAKIDDSENVSEKESRRRQRREVGRERETKFPPRCCAFVESRQNEEDICFPYLYFILF